MGNVYVNVNGTWMTKNAEYVNINGTWVSVNSKYVNINGTWMTSFSLLTTNRNILEEYNAGRIAIGDTYTSGNSYITKSVESTSLTAASSATDHLPIILFHHSAPKRMIFDASSNYLNGSYERAFGVVMFYITTSGTGSSITMSAFELRTYYSNNQYNNNLSVATKGTLALNDVNHTNTTANRISTQSASAVSSFTFDLDTVNKTMTVGGHKISLPSDFSYTYQVRMAVHGWHSGTIKTNLVLTNFRYI